MKKTNNKLLIPKTVLARKNFLKKELQKFVGKKYKCPALSNADVYVIEDSIEETAYHASKSIKSTKAALYLDIIIKNAKYSDEDKPKKGNQTKKFKFKTMYILYCDLKEIGNIKLTIGVKEDGTKIQYCVTAIN